MRFDRKAFTLVEVMVAVAIIILLSVLMIPSIRSMQAGNARAQAYNVINAALQAARSYAIMNSVNTAARFQPNGKVFLVYRFAGDGTSKAVLIGGTIVPCPGSRPVYLPVIDQEPLELPSGYAVTDNPNQFEEPFYVCYNASGTLVASEDIIVALVDDPTSTTPQPVNPNFNGDNIPTTTTPNPAWTMADWTPFVYSLDAWINFTRNDAKNNAVGDISDRKLAKFYYVATDSASLERIYSEFDLGADHYAGRADNAPATIIRRPVSQFSVFQTPDDWSQLPVFINSSSARSRANVLAKEISTKPGSLESIYINIYTGRIIRPLQ